MSIKSETIRNIPRTPGVYLFKRGSIPIYVGKAVNLKNRVSSYFRTNASDKAAQLREEATRLDYIELSSEIEALIKEAELIKQYDPKYNVLIHDYFYVAITKEEYPKIFVTRRPKLPGTSEDSNALRKGKKVFDNPAGYVGPFTSGIMLRHALKSLRRIFPYCTCFAPHKRKCLNAQIGKCSEFCCSIQANRHLPIENRKEYLHTIQSIIAVLTGKRTRLISSIRKELRNAARAQEFERAARLRDQIAGLEDVFRHTSYLREDGRKIRATKARWEETEKIIRETLNIPGKRISRAEGYDISNISGISATGSMVVFIDGKPSKNDYRMFGIKTLDHANDVGMHREVMRRRLQHHEWPLPDLMVIDGGKPQLNAVLSVIQKEKPELLDRVVALAKREEELFRKNLPYSVRLDSLPSSVSFFFQNVRNESHRFAKKYHHKVRELYYRGQTENKNGKTRR